MERSDRVDGPSSLVSPSRNTASYHDVQIQEQHDYYTARSAHMRTSNTLPISCYFNVILLSSTTGSLDNLRSSDERFSSMPFRPC